MQLPDEVITNHIKYKMLQTQFNLCYNDAQEVGIDCDWQRKNWKDFMSSCSEIFIHTLQLLINWN